MYIPTHQDIQLKLSHGETAVHCKRNELTREINLKIKQTKIQFSPHVTSM